MADDDQDPTEPSTEQQSSEEQQALQEAIRLRAYEISQSADAGSPEENWERAKQEIGGSQD